MQKHIRLHYIFFLFIIILFISNVLVIDNITAYPEKTMEIITEEEIYEEKNFSIGVLDPELFNIEDIETPYLSDVEIEFNGKNYYIDENLEVTIKAPAVNQNEIYTIKASKDEYKTAYKNITIIDIHYSKLEIIHDDYIVDAGNKFSVQVFDGDGNIVSGAEVYIQNSQETSSITDERGFAILKAPDNVENFVLIATKDGYDYVTQIFSVNVQPTFWDTIIKNQLFPIFIGALLLISAIIFVTFRQKKSFYNKSEEISDEKTLKKYDLKADVKISKDKNLETQENQYYSRNIVRSQQGKDAKIEEIRITRPSKEKEIIPVNIKEDETEKIINRKKYQKDENEWFKGTDDIRYEIDKLTGEIDEDTVDKWFEGYDNIKDKIDEKIKKKDKTKEKT